MPDGSYNFGSYIRVFTISVTPDGRIYGTVNYQFKTGTNIIFHLFHHIPPTFLLIAWLHNMIGHHIIIRILSISITGQM